MTRLTPAKQIEELTEREFELQLIGKKANPGVARALGWRCFHVLRSKGSEAGFPDWTLVRDRVVFIECKREKGGRVSEAQKEWMRALLAAGAEAYLALPSDLDDLVMVLRWRRGYRPGPANGSAGAASGRLATRTHDRIA